LSIGVLFNLFAALYGTRAIYDYLNFKHLFKSIRFLQILYHPRIDFMRFKNATFVCSIALAISGLVASVQIERAVADQAAALLSREFTENHFVMESKAEIGASVSQAFKQAAVIAIALSLAGIMVYQAWRFARRFGIAALIATSSTVIMVLIALLLAGGILLHDFALALLMGVVVGTYLSIFVASPILYMWSTGRSTPRAAAKNR
jgi:preprotein translocase subunit SecF